MRKIVTQPSAIIVYISAICVFLVPFLFRIVGASSVFRLVISFFVINLILAWAIGRMMRKYQLRWWVSLIMPILFAVNVWLQYAPYNYWLVPIYLVVTWLVLFKD